MNRMSKGKPLPEYISGAHLTVCCYDTVQKHIFSQETALSKVFAASTQEGWGTAALGACVLCPVISVLHHRGNGAPVTPKSSTGFTVMFP